jgi:hypothetical protein
MMKTRSTAAVGAHLSYACYKCSPSKWDNPRFCEKNCILVKIPNLSGNGGLTIRAGSSAQEEIVVKYVLLRAMFDNLI